MSPTELASQLKRGNRRALAKAITLIEDGRRKMRPEADQLLAEVMQPSDKSTRIGISGIPGVGKSTFIETFGLNLINSGSKVAVLAVDPSSPVVGGSILGDKTRMPQLSAHQSAFIRPSPSKLSIGGVTRRTREAILLCEAAGFDHIIVETVGVGQSEVAVSSMTDVFLVLQNPHTGDELQGIKKGVLELADIITITKADGDLESAARQAKVEHERALGYVKRNKDSATPVLTCSGIRGTGIDEVKSTITEFIARQKSQDRFETRRRDQRQLWFSDELLAQVQDRLSNDAAVSKSYETLMQAVEKSKLPASVAAVRLLSEWLEK